MVGFCSTSRESYDWLQNRRFCEHYFVGLVGWCFAIPAPERVNSPEFATQLPSLERKKKVFAGGFKQIAPFEFLAPICIDNSPPIQLTAGTSKIHPNLKRRTSFSPSTSHLWGFLKPCRLLVCTRIVFKRFVPQPPTCLFRYNLPRSCSQRRGDLSKF